MSIELPKRQTPVTKEEHLKIMKQYKDNIISTLNQLDIMIERTCPESPISICLQGQNYYSYLLYIEESTKELRKKLRDTPLGYYLSNGEIYYIHIDDRKQMEDYLLEHR